MENTEKPKILLAPEEKGMSITHLGTNDRDLIHIKARGVGRTAALIALNSGYDRSLAIIDDSIITINGKQYREKVVEKKSGRVPKSMIIAQMLSPGIMNDIDSMINRSLRYISDKPIDLVKEFTLIQDKKSNLTRSQRDAVCHAFNRKYELVNN